LISSPPGTEMFQFPGLPPHRLWIRQVGLQTSLWRGCPIRTSPDHSLLTAPRSFSQPATSFVGSSVPRHPPRALPSSAPRSLDPRQAGRINLLVLPSASASSLPSTGQCLAYARLLSGCQCAPLGPLGTCRRDSSGGRSSGDGRFSGKKSGPTSVEPKTGARGDRRDAFMRLALPQRRWAWAPCLGCGRRAGLTRPATAQYTARAAPGARGRPGPPGGAEGSRTPDLRRAKAALSQLSYGPPRARPAPGGPAWNRTRDLSLIRTAL
jgi:hypothetical protein